MIQTPHTYSEWNTVLDMLRDRQDDAAVLAAMQQGTLAWQSGVAERVAKKLVDTINARMNAATEKFQKSMSRSGGQEGAIVQALLALRKELSFLVKAIDLPVIPEKDRAQYCNLVREQADQIQTSLEDSAKKDRSGKLSSIVRNHKVNVF